MLFQLLNRKSVFFASLLFITTILIFCEWKLEDRIAIFQPKLYTFFEVPNEGEQLVIYNCLAKIYLDLQRNACVYLNKDNESSWIRWRIKKSESIWQKWNEKRQITLIQSAQEYIPYDDKFWTYFSKAFDCPSMLERLGRIDHGGKWVCGFKSLEKANKSHCVVYEHGSITETSFEEELLSRSQHCILRIFNQTDTDSNSKVMKLQATYPDRVFNYSYGLLDTDFLKDDVTVNQDKYISILKINLNQVDLDAFLKLGNRFFKSLPLIGQLLLDINIDGITDSLIFLTLNSLWHILTEHGFRAFHSSPNVITVPSGINNSKIGTHHEFSFLNVKHYRFTAK